RHRDHLLARLQAAAARLPAARADRLRARPPRRGLRDGDDARGRGPHRGGDRRPRPARSRGLVAPAAVRAGPLAVGPDEPSAVVVAESFDLLRAGSLDEVDPELAALLERELERQRDWIDLIASENFAPLSSFSALGSVAANKLAEGYPGRRGGAGCEVVYEIEQAAIDRAKALFGAEHANV